MSLYKHTMDKIKLQEREKKYVQGLYQQVNIQCRRKKEQDMRKIIKRIGMAGAACLVFVAAAGIENIAWKDTQEATMDKHIFTLYVKAAELEEGKYATLVNDITQDWIFCGGDGDNGSIMSYCIGMPISCIGEDIDTITYEINKGAFQIVSMPDDPFIMNGELYDGKLNVGGTGAVEDEVGNILSVDEYYRSFTLDYDRQSGTGDLSWINICGETDYFDDRMFYSDMSDMDRAINHMLEDVKISCTVNFKDGTSEEKVLGVGSKIMTPAEAGDTHDIDQEDLERENVYLIYTLN